MPDELDSLKGALESAVPRRPFDEVVDRAGSARRRGRARRAVAATSVAAVAIVFVAVAVASGLGGEEPKLADGPPADGSQRPARVEPSDSPPTFAYRLTDSGSVRANIPLRVLRAAGAEHVTFEISGTSLHGNDTVRYKVVADRKPGERWATVTIGGDLACRGLAVRGKGVGAVVDVPGRCLPAGGRAARWKVVARPAGDKRVSIAFLAVPPDYPYSPPSG